MAIDLGEKRVGLALSDADGRLSLPHSTVRRTSDRQLLEELREVVLEENVGLLVLGEPVNVDGTRGDAARRSASFARKLEKALGLPCRLVSETLTSVEARERLRQAGIDPAKHPERIDSVAAQILLEQFHGPRPWNGESEPVDSDEPVR